MPQPMTKHISCLVRQLLILGGLLSSVCYGLSTKVAGSKLELDITDLASGLYLLHFDQVATPYKLIKQ